MSLLVSRRDDRARGEKGCIREDLVGRVSGGHIRTQEFWNGMYSRRGIAKGVLFKDEVHCFGS